jgi:hypothetical protein
VDEDALRASTRDLRRTQHLASALDAAAADVRLALASGRDPQRELLAALHLHLGRAWDDGAGHRADLVSALDAARATIAALRRAVGELQRRVSAER